ncbi:MAG: hypothetical protein PHT07_21635 [Paludibacter sp.]|nr:hypothetical protein [Paludibacter sp.]
MGKKKDNLTGVSVVPDHILKKINESDDARDKKFALRLRNLLNKFLAFAEGVVVGRIDDTYTLIGDGMVYIVTGWESNAARDPQDPTEGKTNIVYSKEQIKGMLIVLNKTYPTLGIDQANFMISEANNLPGFNGRFVINHDTLEITYQSNI